MCGWGSERWVNAGAGDQTSQGGDLPESRFTECIALCMEAFHELLNLAGRDCDGVEYLDENILVGLCIPVLRVARGHDAYGCIERSWKCVVEGNMGEERGQDQTCDVQTEDV